jgi:hypothetical protein
MPSFDEDATVPHATTARGEPDRQPDGSGHRRTRLRQLSAAVGRGVCPPYGPSARCRHRALLRRGHDNGCGAHRSRTARAHPVPSACAKAAGAVYAVACIALHSTAAFPASFAASDTVCRPQLRRRLRGHYATGVRANCSVPPRGSSRLFVCDRPPRVRLCNSLRSIENCLSCSGGCASTSRGGK